ncbi:hypothetical protein ACHAW5_009981 [Stephanodiscus triporus]|uniref:Glycosyltransferase 2-like domain-containing protein n=1 Tax=Stephanodiscus triporus TaxID=2934178 RepID=A0ABD3PU79_9STRA
MLVIKVDVITAVHNAESTIEEAVRSAMGQEIPPGCWDDWMIDGVLLDVCVCCYDDASTDDSLSVLRSLSAEYDELDDERRRRRRAPDDGLPADDGDDAAAGARDDAGRPRRRPGGATIRTRLLIGAAPSGTRSRGAGYARNRAVDLRRDDDDDDDEGEDDDGGGRHFLCIMDADDVMRPTRVAEQARAMLDLDGGSREKTIVGCVFDRTPEGSTRHYASWANSLSDDRLYLERFRECTLVSSAEIEYSARSVVARPPRRILYFAFRAHKIQPTWFLSRTWFERLGGYPEAPPTIDGDDSDRRFVKRAKIDAEAKEFGNVVLGTSYSDRDGPDDRDVYRLCHPSEILPPTSSSAAGCDDVDTLRLAEDTRLFHAHLRAGGRLHLHRTPVPLVLYRHRSGLSQSSSTPRRLLLKLRARAWEDAVFRCKLPTSDGVDGDRDGHKWTSGFAVWGAGRDGKDFLKALSPDVVSKVVCLVDVDRKKIDSIKWYDNPALLRGRRIPILHFSVLASGDVGEEGEAKFGRIDKRKWGEGNFVVPSSHQRARPNEGQDGHEQTSPSGATKKREKEKKVHDSIDPEVLRRLPVVVCVAMYRTNGALESNVASIGRIEGKDLWHLI